jgi:acyl-CoA thioesterase-1
LNNLTFLGDSLTAGYGLASPSTESVPGLIQHKINAENLGYIVHHGGLNGSTSSNGLYRLDYWLNRPIDAFVLELGINDLIRKIPAERTKYNLRQIIQKVKNKNPDSGIGVMGMRLPKCGEFNQIFADLADEFKLPLVPFYLEGVAGNRMFNLPDGLHPNAIGYKIIAGNIWPVIRDML